MTVLWIGLGLFFGVHLIPMTPLKPALVRALGDGRYKAVFSLLSLNGLIVIVLGYRQAPVEFVFAPKSWGRTAALHTMPVAFILLAHGLLFNRVPVSIQAAQ